MTPEEIMTMDDDSFDKLDTSVEVDKDEKKETAVEEPSVEDTSEVPAEVVEPTEPSEESEELTASSIMELDDEAFDKLLEKSKESPSVDDNLASKEEETYNKGNSSKESLPTVEDLKAQSQVAKHSEEEVSEYHKHKDIVEALRSNDLLDNGKVNNIIEITKGNKQAIVALLKDLGITAKDLSGNSETAKVETETDKSSTEGDEDDFDKWFDSLNGKEPKAEEKSEDKPEAKEKPPEVKEPEVPATEETIDHVAMEATKRVGVIVAEIQASEGVEFLNDIDRLIDAPSFEMLKENPMDIRHLAEQKKSGVFQMVNDHMAELDKSGFFPKDLPYLSKYKMSANLLIREGMNKPAPIETRASTLKKEGVAGLKHAESSTMGNSEKSPPKELTPLDIMNMSDEDFNKL